MQNDALDGIDQGWAARRFAGVDFVGIDFSTSIQCVAGHVIGGWNHYRLQMETLRRDHGIWAFGVNAIAFPLTRRPVRPSLLPNLHEDQFQWRGCGRGLIECGSAFYDYFFMALGLAQELIDDSGRTAVPITISLLCDGWPNGGAYRASDVRPLLAQARSIGVRVRLVGFVPRSYLFTMERFRDSLGLTSEEVEFAWYEGAPNEQTMETGFGLLTQF